MKVYGPVLTWVVLALHPCPYLLFSLPPQLPMSWSLKNCPHITSTLSRRWEQEPASPAQHRDCYFTSETRDHTAENVFWKLPSAALVQSSSMLQWPLLILQRKALSAWELLWAREWGNKWTCLVFYPTESNHALSNSEIKIHFLVNRHISWTIHQLLGKHSFHF